MNHTWYLSHQNITMQPPCHICNCLSGVAAKQPVPHRCDAGGTNTASKQITFSQSPWQLSTPTPHQPPFLRAGTGRCDKELFNCCSSLASVQLPAHPVIMPVCQRPVWISYKTAAISRSVGAAWFSAWAQIVATAWAFYFDITSSNVVPSNNNNNNRWLRINAGAAVQGN